MPQNRASNSHIVAVNGDVTIDWNLQRTRSGRNSGATWNAADAARAYWQRGGAALLADLVEAVAKDVANASSRYEVRQMGAPKEHALPSDPRYHHSYAMWSPYDCGRTSLRWRVAEFLGLDASRRGPGDWNRVVDDTGEADVVVLDDAALGFREHRDLWPLAVTENGRRPWIILKMAKPVASGGLWEHLRQNHADRLIVVMAVNDLRLTEVQISRELSWERTTQDLIWELLYNPHVDSLSDCAHVVVSFDTAGALLLSRRGPAEHRCLLVFDPEVVEGIWSQKYPGGMIGYTSCLTASIARQLMLPDDQQAGDLGIRSGLSAMRKLHQLGYGGQEPSAPPCELAFPIDEVVKELRSDTTQFAEVEVEDPVRMLTSQLSGGAAQSKAGAWTILEDLCARTMDQASMSLDQVAEQIVRQGTASVLRGVPVGRFGNLMTVDRREIESYRSVRVLINQYLRQSKHERPLSVGVFGAPGSGKSFGITEVAKSIDARIEKLTFNLSQFSDPSELLGALHQVRDIVLSGHIPLVFWDEFDTALEGSPLGWLRCFLAPMQDGNFQEGQITHPIGRAIFVFAGGTSESFESFGKKMKPEKFEAAKGPDFLSRLKGFINIIGPNPMGGDSARDPYYIIRRAILLRSMLERSSANLFHLSDPKGELQMDSGVLRALLTVQEYRHGARSMESVIAMSQLADRTHFERSALPTREQLNLHVDGRAFLALVQQIVLDEQALERLAEINHLVYKTGFAGKLKTSNAQKAFAELSAHEKEQNRDNVRDIPSKLAAVGCVMVPARGNQQSTDISGLVEQLAELEHWRWMNLKISNDWRWAAERDDEKKLHPALLPWRKLSEQERLRLYTPEQRAAIGVDELPEGEKQKDRDLVRGIPGVLAAAGYMVVRVQDRMPR